MNQNLIERYRHRVAVAQHHIAEAVAHENDVDARFINNAGRGKVVSGQTNQSLAALFACFQRRERLPFQDVQV